MIIIITIIITNTKRLAAVWQAQKRLAAVLSKSAWVELESKCQMVPIKAYMGRASKKACQKECLRTTGP